MSEQSEITLHYVADFRAAVEACETLGALTTLWLAHSPARQRRGIVEGNADYRALVEMCGQQKGKINARVQP